MASTLYLSESKWYCRSEQLWGCVGLQVCMQFGSGESRLLGLFSRACSMAPRFLLVVFDFSGTCSAAMTQSGRFIRMVKAEICAAL